MLMWVVLGVAGLMLLVGVVLYNSLVARKNQVDNAFAGMDAMLKKRFDLIPNLVATVRQYARHEAETLANVTRLRTEAMSSGAGQRVDAENQITRALGGLMVAVENYPQLKADANFRQLQGSLNEVEEQISASRRAYNAAVTDLNNAIEMFPTNVLASMMGYQKRPLFEIPQQERQNVNVQQLFNA